MSTELDRLRAVAEAARPIAASCMRASYPEKRCRACRSCVLLQALAALDAAPKAPKDETLSDWISKAKSLLGQNVNLLHERATHLALLERCADELAYYNAGGIDAKAETEDCEREARAAVAKARGGRIEVVG